MTKLALAAALVAALAVWHPSSAQDLDPLNLYGPRIEFDILRNGDRIGGTAVAFRRDGDLVSAVTDTNLAVKVLFVTVLTLTHHAEETWRAGQLVSLSAVTRTNGAERKVTAVRTGDVLTVSIDGAETTTNPNLLLADDWDMRILASREVLDPLGGRMIRIASNDRGAEQVATKAGMRTALRYALTGERTAEIWYDDRGRWVRSRVKGWDGSYADYVCQVCGGP